MRYALLAAGLLTLFALPAGPAVAHAILMTSDPAAGSSIPAGPRHIVLHYNSRIDQARSRLELRGAGTPPVVLKIGPASSDALATDVTLRPGAWTLRWQVLAVDGHITRGDVPLTVNPAP
jgi:methionine-rich copper-binding protein CopC